MSSYSTTTPTVIQLYMHTGFNLMRIYANV